MNIRHRILYLGTFFTVIVGLFLSYQSPSIAESRWYEQSAVDKGDQLFQQHCASCHKPNAEGTQDWKKTNEQGQYPPPPLNGTAHAWHHDLDILRNTVREGGAKLGGVMPPFKEILSQDEIDAVIAYFQSKWSDDLYQKWANRFQGENMPAIAPKKEDAVQQKTQSPGITDWLQKRLGKSDLPEPVKTEVEGIYQVQLGAQQVYLVGDGRYAFTGDLIDLKTGKNLTQSARREFANGELRRFPSQDKITIQARSMEIARIHVFTDTTCPYCKKLHSEVPKLQQAGISVVYLPYPRGGKSGPGYQSLKQVWCADDRELAMSIAKEVELGDLPSGDCEAAAAVDAGYELGNRLGITGTPAIYLPNAQRVDGYVPHEELINIVLRAGSRF